MYIFYYSRHENIVFGQGTFPEMMKGLITGPRNCYKRLKEKLDTDQKTKWQNCYTLSNLTIMLTTKICYAELFNKNQLCTE